MQPPDFESLVRTFLWILVFAGLIALAAYWILRWVAFRIAHRLTLAAERQVAARIAPGVSRTQARFAKPPVVSDDYRSRRLAELDRLAWLMDRVIPLPIIGGVGLDALLGLFPIAGDTASLAISSIIIVRAAQIGAPPELIGRLIAILILDYLVGFIPLVGDVVDAGYKANVRSVELLRNWIESTRVDHAKRSRR